MEQLVDQENNLVNVLKDLIEHMRDYLPDSDDADMVTSFTPEETKIIIAALCYYKAEIRSRIIADSEYMRGD